MKDLKTSARVTPVDIFGDNVYERLSVGFGVIDMTSESSDYYLGNTGVDQAHTPKYMVLIPETAADIVVELLGQDEGVTYTITAVQATAYLGKPLPYKVRKVVKSGTTGTFSVTW